MKKNLIILCLSLVVIVIYLGNFEMPHDVLGFYSLGDDVGPFKGIGDDVGPF